MKPNDPLNRETLLSIVSQTLATASDAHSGDLNDRSTGTDGTLGAVVRQIMARLSQDAPANESLNVNANPVPLDDVAAYVDGTLDDEQKRNAITKAASNDPGLMMEIVSAIRSHRETAAQGISTDLRSRLIALRSQSEAKSKQVLPPSPESRQTRATFDVGTPVVTATPTATPTATRTATRTAGNATFKWGPIAAFMTAATVLFAVGWWFRREDAPQIDPIAKEPMAIESPDLGSPLPNNKTRQKLGPPRAVDPMLVERTDSDRSHELNLAPRSPVDLTPDMLDSQAFPPENIANHTDPLVKTDPMAIAESDPNGSGSAPTSPDQTSDPIRPTSSAPATRLIAEWTQIDGLLLRQDSPLGATTSQSGESAPASVVVGTAFDLASDALGAKLRLQTLPLCRATAKLAGGGELVLAGDTQLDLTFGGAIDLQYGSFALLGMNDQSVAHLGRNIVNSVSLEGRPGGSIVVRKTVTGMEVDVTGASVKVGGQTFVDSRLNVEDRLLAVDRIDDAPNRLPRWTRERVDRIEVGRTVLAQLSSSTDVRATMMQSLRSGAVRGSAAVTLRGWLVASSNGDLLRLIGSPDTLIREAALRHLRNVNPKDPRHRMVWRSLQANGKNQRTYSSVRTFFVDLWSGRRPTPTRREQLLRMLQAPDAATRATANYLLRSFYGPGPRFDLTAGAAVQTRTINAWRAVINRTD